MTLALIRHKAEQEILEAISHMSAGTVASWLDFNQFMAVLSMHKEHFGEATASIVDLAQIVLKLGITSPAFEEYQKNCNKPPPAAE